MFTVLPFGLSTAPYISTKCVRPLERYCHFSGLKIAVFLDDGFAVVNGYNDCELAVSKVRKDLNLLVS